MDFIEHKISLPVGVSPGNYFVIEIGDEGKGIVKEVLDRIFEPFFTTKSPGEGTGLGLSTCLGIIEQHQGHITVDTVVDEGSIFRIFLPLYQPNLPAVAGSWHTAEPDRSSNSILVVEDNDSIREAIVLSLKSRGYAVHQSKNGREALELIKSNTAAPFSLLITDLMMPEMGGKALASFVKMVQYNLKTLFISGFSDSDNMPVGSEFLAKPFSTEQLFAKVADLLEK
jgi:two-component system cell cycle sensor histidine kinase/response regulator CckA